MNVRIEHDSLGDVEVNDEKYWGAQTQRSFMNFPIGQEKMPEEIINAFLLLKKACALANMSYGKLDPVRGAAIVQACDEILSGKLSGNFPLAVWQTGSGTQSNMNVNEVIANRATEIINGSFRNKKALSRDKLVHPNDQVNMSQSSNDTFPSALHIMCVLEVFKQLIPAIQNLREALEAKTEEFKDLIKSGRTHLQDATPITLGQEFSGYASMLEHAEQQILVATNFCRELAIGGTAVGTGINAPKDFGERVCKELTALTGMSFKSAPNKFHSLTSKDATVFLSGALKALAADLMKIANDIRWLASGPRCGLGEINLPANEPGSSIMPGKVNPVIPEVVNQICYRIIGNDLTVTFAAEAGQLQLNVMEPVMVHAIFSSIKMLQKGMDRLRILCVEGITANTQHCREMVLNSIGIVTALNPTLGYENSSRIAKRALKENRSVYDLVLEEGLLTKDELDQLLKPESMIKPHKFYKKK